MAQCASLIAPYVLRDLGQQIAPCEPPHCCQLKLDRFGETQAAEVRYGRGAASYRDYARRSKFRCCGIPTNPSFPLSGANIKSVLTPRAPSKSACRHWKLSHVVAERSAGLWWLGRHPNRIGHSKGGHEDSNHQRGQPH